MSIDEEKANLRQISKNGRMNISTKDREVAEQAIVNHVIEYCNWCSEHGVIGKPPKHIALYFATRGEVRLNRCFPLLVQADWRVLFPRIEDAGHLNMYRTEHLSQLHSGSFNIPEPGPETILVRPEDVDIVLVPGLSFTRDGRRLGYGGGYYDRFLARCRLRCRFVGIAFECQVADDLPAASHDVRMHALITERGVVACKTGQSESF